MTLLRFQSSPTAGVKDWGDTADVEPRSEDIADVAALPPLAAGPTDRQDQPQATGG